MMQVETTFGRCMGGCGTKGNTCFVRKLPPLSGDIPDTMMQSLRALHDLAVMHNMPETFVVSSGLETSESAVMKAVELYERRLVQLILTVGDTKDKQLTGFAHDKFPILWDRMNNEGELIITFDHTNEETSGLIYASFDRALNFLLENHKKIPDGRSLGICLEKNNSKKVGLWAYCYIRFLNALRNGRQTGNHALDTSIKKARDILGQLKDETELHYGDLRPGKPGFTHDCEIIGTKKYPILIQVIPDVEQSSLVNPADGSIIPLVTPVFVAPIHNTYAMNHDGNRMGHEEFQQMLGKIPSTGNVIQDYNRIFGHS